MAQAKRILITGATGAQGGSVARYLLQTKQLQVRCLTRDLSSAQAEALRKVGAEVVRGDLSEPDSLAPALRDCWGVFGVTNFWEHFAKEREHGINLVDAVAQSEVDCFVFSTLPPAKKISGLDVPHFDIKAELEEYARKKKPGSIYTHVAYYYQNWLAWFAPKRQADGTYAFGFPQGDARLAAVSVEDVGGVVAPIFQNPQPFRERVVGVVGDDRPCSEYAAIMSRVLGVTVRYQHMPVEQFAALGFAGADDLANMFDFNRRHIPDRQADLEQSRKLFPQIQSFEQWAQTHADQLRAAIGG